MAENFDDLDDQMQESDVAKMYEEKLQFDKIFLDVFNTPAGKRMFETLSERHVQTQMARLGDSPDQIFYRQGMSDLVTQMYKCVEDALTPHVAPDEAGQG